MVRSRPRRLCTETAVQRQERPGSWLVEILLTLAIVAVGVALFLPMTRTPREAARRSQCRNNLKQIGLALHNYFEDQGALPPAYTVDANGEPLHSWRTLILPYLDQSALYETIDLSKPWNDPVNSEAAATLIHTYSCPSADIPERHTTCLAVVGPECGFRATTPRRLTEFTDGIANTVWVVDATAVEAVHWMDPIDSVKPFFLSYSEKSRLPHSGGIQVLMADGTVRFLPTELDAATREALITIAGGEQIGEL